MRHRGRLVRRQYTPDSADQVIDRPDFDRRSGGGQPVIDVLDLEDMRAVDDSRPQGRGFKRVMAADLDQRTTQKRHRCQPVPQTHLAQRVGQIDLGIAVGQFPLGTHRNIPTVRLQLSGNLRAAFGMARRDDQQQALCGARRLPMRGGDHFFFALMGRCGQPDRSPGQLLREHRALGFVERQSRRAFLQRARHLDTAAGQAQPDQVAAGLFILRQNVIEPPEQRARHPRQPAPAAMRLGRDPCIDQQHRNGRRCRFMHQTRPQFAFSPNRQIGLPVFQEPPDQRAHIDGHELVYRMIGQPTGHQRRRGDRAGGDQEIQIFAQIAQTPDQFQNRQRLANTGGMKPDQRAIRPWQ